MSIDFAGCPEPIKNRVIGMSEEIDFDKSINKGANGYIFIGQHKILKRRTVVKFYYCGGADHAEPSKLVQLECPNVLKVYHAERVEGDWAFFTAECCEDGDLDDLLVAERLGPIRAINIILQILAGTSYLHGHGFIHRDLKPSNVFCMGGRALLGDFGSVAEVGAGGIVPVVTRHSLLYRTPEEISENKVSRLSDIYQIGITLYQLLGGALPYLESDWLNVSQKVEYLKLSGFDQQAFAREIIEAKILSGKLLNYKSLPSWVPSKLTSIIRTCCKVSPGDRFESAAALIAKLSNVRGSVPDWQYVDGNAVLFRRGKQFRISPAGAGFAIEKRTNVGGAWRRMNALQPKTWATAVATAEAQR